MKSGDGFMLVYSIVSAPSVIEASTIRDQLYTILGKEQNEHIPMCLLGNKVDLESNREVSTDEVKKIAESWGVQFFEVSAKTRYNIVESFNALVRELLKERSTTGEVTGTASNNTDDKKKKKKCMML